MKIHILSDLHMEHGEYEQPDVEADITILAGDIHTHSRCMNGTASQIFKRPTLMVAGNHEFYAVKIDTELEKLRPIAKSKGVTLLNNEIYEIDGVRFLGCTLWSDFRLFAGEDDEQCARDMSLCIGSKYGSRINDFHKIRIAKEGYRKFTPKHAANLFDESVDWLDESLTTIFNGETVVITHHAPSMLCVPKNLMSDHMSCAYASKLDWLILKHQPRMWIYGHIHDSVPPFYIGDTLMISNPRGYTPTHLNPAFDPCLVIDI